MFCQIVQCISIILTNHLHIHKAKIEEHFQNWRYLPLFLHCAHKYLIIYIIKNRRQLFSDAVCLIIR